MLFSLYRPPFFLSRANTGSGQLSPLSFLGGSPQFIHPMYMKIFSCLFYLTIPLDAALAVFRFSVLWISGTSFFCLTDLWESIFLQLVPLYLLLS